jgi:hypothetical protein
MLSLFMGNKRWCDFIELIYGPRNHWPDDIYLLLSLDSDDLPCHHAPVPLCQCGVPAKQGLAPSVLGYGYFCGNVVGEVMMMNEWVHIKKFLSNHFICRKWLLIRLCRQDIRHCDWEEFDGREGFFWWGLKERSECWKRIMYEKKKEMRRK